MARTQKVAPARRLRGASATQTPAKSKPRTPGRKATEVGKRRATGKGSAATSRPSAQLTFRVYRMWMDRFEDEAGRRNLHMERAKLLHGLVDTLGLEVKDWGETDSAHPREVVEVVIALAPIVVPALVAVINTWIKEVRIKQVTVKKPDGTEIDIRGITPRQLTKIAHVVQ